MLPTSVTSAPGFSLGAISLISRMLVSTGVQRKTKSLSATDSAASTEPESIAPISCARRSNSVRPQPTMCSATPHRRKASASEPPISPRPITLTRFSDGRPWLWRATLAITTVSRWGS